MYHDEPVSQAIVSIRDHEELKTSSDENGEFKLMNVPAGNHVLIMEKGNDKGQFSANTLLITVDGNLSLDALTLPDPIELFSPSDVKDNSLHLTWSACNAPDFREYKIYQHTTSGLDETTGKLIHVSTSRGDTSFTVTNLNPLTDYYFRVYIMNDVGRLGGSNIVSARTANRQLLRNGSFEILNGSTKYPENWQAMNSLQDYYFVDTSTAQDGDVSIRIENAPGVNIYYQLVNPQELIGGTRYKLSYWVKHDGLPQSGDEFAVFMNSAEFTWRLQVNTVNGPLASTDWQFFEYEFTAPTISTSNYIFGFYFWIGSGKRAWLDNVSLIKI